MSYTPADLEGDMEHMESFPIRSFKKVALTQRCTNQPWTVRQYAGFSTKIPTLFDEILLAKRPVGGFDLATHRGYDEDHERVRVT